MYDPELAFMDAQIARIRAWLDENGQLGNTVVVITADHGQGLRDGHDRHGWMKHRLLYDWSVRVPLIVHVPGFAPSQPVVDEQVRTIDVLPTIAEAIEAPLRNLVEGTSLMPLMRGETEDEPRVAYADALSCDQRSPPAAALPPHRKDNLFMACDGRELIHHESNGTPSSMTSEGPLGEEPLSRSPAGGALLAFLGPTRHGRRAPGSGSSAPNVAALNALGYGGGGDEDEETNDETAPK